MGELELDGFDAFVAARLPYLLRLGRALTGSDRAAAELVREALERTSLRWSRVESDDPEGHVRRAMVARSLAARQRVRREAPAGRGPQPLPEDLQADAAVWHALARLPARQRVVVALRYGEEVSEAGTAELLGVSPGSVRHQARQAMARLRQLLAEEPAGRVRRTLQHPIASADAERVLAEVHRGARRRRQRRTRMVVACTLLAAGAAVAVMVGVARSDGIPDAVPRPVGTATPDEEGTRITRGDDDLAGLAGTTGIDGPGPGAMWRVDAEPCGDVLCARIYREGSSAGWEPVAGLAYDDPAHARGSGLAPVDSIRVGADPRNAWAFGAQLWSTHDGGASWLRQELAGATPGAGLRVEPLGGEVFALQTAPVRLWRSASPVDIWTPVAVPDGLSSADQLLAVGDRLVLSARKARSGDPVLLLSDDGGARWQEVPAPCGVATAPIGGTGAVLMTYCPGRPSGGSAASVLRSTDGARWSVLAGVDVPTPVDGTFPVDAGTAFVVTGAEGLIVTADRVVTVDLGTGTGSRVVLGRFVDPEYGYLVVDSPRRLLGTENGGRTWTALD